MAHFTANDMKKKKKFKVENVCIDSLEKRL